MISVKEATQLILSNASKCATVSMSLLECDGYTLRETLYADRDMPPFDRVMMDGIAIRYEDFINGQINFPISGLQAAGMPSSTSNEANACIEIMTGAVLPDFYDTVVRYEDLKMDGNNAIIQIDHIHQGQHIHHRGKDKHARDELVATGTRISGAEIGIAASIGKSYLIVSKPPSTCIISTGDELVDILTRPLPYQIRKSNVYTIASILKECKIKADLFHFNDNKTEINQGLISVLNKYDLVILSGGVSAGKFDFIPDLLKENGTREVFYKIQQKPGKPFWFGIYKEKTTVFALPGNPVSSFLGTVRYILPWIKMSSGAALKPAFGVLAQDYEFKPALTCFLQVTTQYAENGMTMCYPIPGHGSGDFANLAVADAFLELPPDRNSFVEGEAFPLWRIR